MLRYVAINMLVELVNKYAINIFINSTMYLVICMVMWWLPHSAHSGSVWTGGGTAAYRDTVLPGLGRIVAITAVYRLILTIRVRTFRIRPI